MGWFWILCVVGTLGSYATEHWVGFFVVRVYGRFFRIILQCKGISVVVHGLKIFSLKNLILFSFLCPKKKTHKIKLTTLSFNFDYNRFRNKAFQIKIFWIIENRVFFWKFLLFLFCKWKYPEVEKFVHYLEFPQFGFLHIMSYIST